MARLQLEDKFKIEVPKQDGTFDVYEGSLRVITKKEQKELESEFKDSTDLAKSLTKKTNRYNKIAKKIDRLETIDLEKNIDKIEALEVEFEALEDEINADVEKLNNMDAENNALKKKMALLLGAESKNEIMNLGLTYGYKIVWETIQEGISEGKSKEQKN